LELGCGDGRDAAAILKQTSNYLGIDISQAFISIAREKLSNGRFEVADMVDYVFQKDLDIIFAFASMLHLSKREVKIVLDNAAQALKPAGIFYISLKYKPRYGKSIKEDQFGKRLFYYYNAEIIAGLAGENYEIAKTWREVHGHTDWVEIALRRK
jgi:SAM-dependent methyltransferase